MQVMASDGMGNPFFGNKEKFEIAIGQLNSLVQREGSQRILSLLAKMVITFSKFIYFLLFPILQGDGKLLAFYEIKIFGYGNKFRILFLVNELFRLAGCKQKQVAFSHPILCLNSHIAHDSILWIATDRIYNLWNYIAYSSDILV